VAGTIRIVAVGRDRPGPFGELTRDFLSRSQRFAGVQLVRVKSSSSRRADDRRRDEAELLVEKSAGQSRTVALDSRGAPLASETFGRRLARWRESSDVTLLVGGPDGLDPALCERCDEVVSLGPMTLPHELALVVLLEQVYRALASDAGHPYARH